MISFHVPIFVLFSSNLYLYIWILFSFLNTIHSFQSTRSQQHACLSAIWTCLTHKKLWAHKSCSTAWSHPIKCGFVKSFKWNSAFMYHVSFKNKGLTPQQHRVSSWKVNSPCSLVQLVCVLWHNFRCQYLQSTAGFFFHHSANIRVATLLYHRQTGFV